MGPYFTGVGSGTSLGPALTAAKEDAVRGAVIAAIGRDAEAAQRDTLNEVLYGVSNLRRYVDNDSMEILRRENRGSVDEMDLLVEIRIRVDTNEIESVLARHDISPNPDLSSSSEGTPREAAPERGADPDGEQSGRDQDGGDGAATAVDIMTMMVVADPDTAVAQEYLTPAVNQANRYLIEAGYTVVEQSQVQELLRDRELAYEEATGERASVLQWVAQRLRADVYVTVNVTTHGEIDGEEYYGNATVNLSMYETSTAQMLGSVSRRSQRTFSRASLDDAVINAVQSTTYAAMSRVEDQVRSRMADSLRKGIRYEVTIQRSLSSRMMSDFRTELREDVSELVTESQTAEETVYTVYYRGRIEELEDLIYDISRDVPGMQDLYHVLTRGRNLVFNSGL